MTSYNDLTDLPTLGTAAATDASAYAPATHKSSHAAGGADAITPADIGALGLSASSCIIAMPSDDLAAKYTAAKALMPNGSALSATNRAALIIMPGVYNLSETLNVDTQFVDIVGLGSVKLDRGCIPAVTFAGNTINITANNVRVKGISVGTQSFKVASNLNFLILEDCLGGDYSFCAGLAGESFDLSSTLINCQAGNSSFGVGGSGDPVASEGGSGTISGTLTDCTAGNNSFGVGAQAGGGFSCGAGTITGTLTNCKAGNNSFGIGGSDVSYGGLGGAGTISGTLTDCTAGNNSFGVGGSRTNGGNGTLSGTLTNCTAGSNSFGVGGNATNNNGGAGTISGTLTNCTAGSNSFGIGGSSTSGVATSGGAGTITSTGLLNNCKAGNNSFGVGGVELSCGDTNGNSGSGTVAGNLTNCSAGDSSFGVGSSCSFGQSAGVVSGTLTSCIAGTGSFGVGYDGYDQPAGSGSVISGKLYYTRLTAGTFGTVSGSGLMRMCIDGNNDIVDQG